MRGPQRSAHAPAIAGSGGGRSGALRSMLPAPPLGLCLRQRPCGGLRLLPNALWQATGRLGRGLARGDLPPQA